MGLPWMAAALVATGACASAGSTWGSGVGDALVEHPPFYAGQSLDTVDVESGRVAHLPVAYQRGASEAEIFDPPHDRVVAPLLASMTDFVEGLGASVPLIEGAPDAGTLVAPRGTPPDVQFSCPPATSGVEDLECEERADGALGRGSQPMLLAVGRPSDEWTAWLGRAMEAGGADYALVITLETAPYWIRQRGLRGTKVVELGTGHVAELPWLTSLETPVSVIQVTGALVDREGRAVRIGAEGLFARRTRLSLSALGAQELITTEDVRELVASRREDLPGSPLAWQVGLRELVAGLTGKRTVVE